MIIIIGELLAQPRPSGILMEGSISSSEADELPEQMAQSLLRSLDDRLVWARTLQGSAQTLEAIIDDLTVLSYFCKSDYFIDFLMSFHSWPRVGSRATSDKKKKNRCAV